MSQRNTGRSAFGNNPDYSENLRDDDLTGSSNPLSSGTMRRDDDLSNPLSSGTMRRDDNLGQLGGSDQFDTSRRGVSNIDKPSMGTQRGAGDSSSYDQPSMRTSGLESSSMDPSQRTGVTSASAFDEPSMGTQQRAGDTSTFDQPSQSGDPFASQEQQQYGSTTRQTRSSGRRGDDTLGDTFGSQEQYGSTTGGTGGRTGASDTFDTTQSYGRQGVSGIGTTGGDTTWDDSRQPQQKKGDSTMGKFVEKAGNAIGSKSMEQKGREKRYDEGFQE